MSLQQLVTAFTSRDAFLAVTIAGACYVLVRILRPASKTTSLRGPPRGNILLGQSEVLRKAEDGAAEIEEGWVNEYGAVYKRPLPMGSSLVAMTDPKAVAHFYSNGETTFTSTSVARRLIDDLIGRGILTADGDDHKRQRRALTAGFSNAKLREYTAIFFEAAYKVKAAWDQKLENSDNFEIDITPWMNAISLDSMGLAGFSHDFGSLDGKNSEVASQFTRLMNIPFTLLNIIVFLLQPVIPALMYIPSERTRARTDLKAATGRLARQLLNNLAGSEDAVDGKSILGLIIKSQTATTGFPMSEEEVNAQMRTLMVAGFETTSVTMTWALIELARRPEIQVALRKELEAKFSESEPTWDDLMTDLPMLDAVVHETLRLHPSVIETVRAAAHDDVIPLSAPIRLPNGQMTDQIFVAAGEKVAVPIRVVNRLRSLWGEDAWEFKPERWLNDGEGIPAAAKDIQGHRHLVTFIAGPRTCLGKNFAVAEFKAAFSVLIRNYHFEFPGGPETKIRKHFALISRPTVEGQPRCHVPMRITRVE